MFNLCNDSYQKPYSKLVTQEIFNIIIIHYVLKLELWLGSANTLLIGDMVEPQTRRMQDRAAVYAYHLKTQKLGE